MTIITEFKSFSAYSFLDVQDTNITRKDEYTVLNESNVSLPLGIFELDVQGRVMAYNAYGSDLKLKPRADVIGHSFFGELLEPTCRALEDGFRYVLTQRVPFSRLYFREKATEGQSVLLMFFSDSESVVIQIEKVRYTN